MATAFAIAGYLLLMLSNPVRESLRDGWRCIRRYPTIWITLAWLGCANALFQLLVRIVFQMRGMGNMTWFRPQIGQDAPAIWALPPDGIDQSISGAWIPALESVAGLFNNAVTTFPIAVLAAIGLLFNSHRYFRVLRTALQHRFGVWHWPIVGFVVACAIATICKAALYLKPPGLPDEAWFQWAPVVVMVASIWEYLFGLAVQTFLIMHAFAWVRGITFDSDAMREVSIRRFASGVKWAVVVMLIGLVLIEIPLVLKNFPSWQAWFPDDSTIVETRLKWARIIIALLLIGFGSMQAWMALHGETLTRALAAHWRLCRQHGISVCWFVLVAAVHLWAVSFSRAVILAGLGADTAPGIAWTLAWPWLAGAVSGWLLASWVCVFKKCEGGGSTVDQSAGSLLLAASSGSKSRSSSA